MKKKTTKMLILSVILIFILSLTGCGKEEELNFEFNRDAMQQYTQELVTKYSNTSEVEQDYFLNEGSDLEKTAVAGFLAADSTDHVGNFIDFAQGSDSVTFSNGADGKVVCSQICNYSGRDVKVAISYRPNKAFELDKEKLYENLVKQASQYGMDVTSYVTQVYGSYPELDMSSMDKFLDSYLAAGNDERPFEAVECEVSAVYTKKELITMAGKNTAIGMGVVFTVLIFISFIISLLKFLPMIFDADIRRARAEKKAAQEAAQKQTEDMIIGNRSDEKKESSPAAPKAEPAVFAKPAAKAEENLMNDEELVAVITAAIYAASGSVRGPAYTASNDKLIVRSIRRAR